jgi:hypothetical protein
MTPSANLTPIITLVTPPANRRHRAEKHSRKNREIWRHPRDISPSLDKLAMISRKYAAIKKFATRHPNQPKNHRVASAKLARKRRGIISL